MGEMALSLYYGGCTAVLGVFAYYKLKKEFESYLKQEAPSGKIDAKM